MMSRKGEGGGRGLSRGWSEMKGVYILNRKRGGFEHFLEIYFIFLESFEVRHSDL